MRNLLACIAALLVAGTARAEGTDYPAQLTWSTATQSVGPEAWCYGIDTNTSYDGRWDLTLPAQGIHPAVTLVLSPEEPYGDSWSYDAGDGATRVNIGRNMDKRLLAFNELMVLHLECAKGGSDAQSGCVPLGRVEAIADVLFKNPNTGADFSPDTYTAPRAQFPQGTGYVWRFTQARHLYDRRGGNGATTLRQTLFRSLTNGYDTKQKWATYDTPGATVTCTECDDSGSELLGNYQPGKASDIDTFSPAQIAAAEAILLAPLEEDEYVIVDGEVQVPVCPQD